MIIKKSFIKSSLVSSCHAVCFFLLVAAFMVSSCNKHDTPKPVQKEPVIYVESNDFHDNKNAIIAFRINAEGSMEPLPGSPFLTGGAGLGNPAQILGPDDQDTPIMITEDGKFLLAVNGGSNTIAVFTINMDGSLHAVSGSPFPSGGETPVSLAPLNNYIFAVNKSQNPLAPVSMKPNYSTFTIATDGSLSKVAGGKFETTEGASPAQVLVSNDHKFLFGADFLSFMADPPLGTLRSFVISASGTLMPVAGTPQMIPGAGGALGLWQHPKDNTLYVGFPVQSKIGVYEINPTTGGLAFKTSVIAGAAACWLRTNKQGDRLYVLNSAEGTVGVYNTTNSLTPVFMSKLTLKKTGPTYGATNAVTSEPFNFCFSPSGKILYVVSQHTNTDFSIGNYNYFHSLQVMEDGSLSEAQEPAQMPVAPNLRPQGVVVY